MGEYLSATVLMIWMLGLTALLTSIECGRGNWRVIGVVCCALSAGMFVGKFIQEKAHGR